MRSLVLRLSRTAPSTDQSGDNALSADCTHSLPHRSGCTEEPPCRTEAQRGRHTGCITPVCHSGCVTPRSRRQHRGTAGASQRVRHTGCVKTGASHRVRHIGCVTSGASHRGAAVRTDSQRVRHTEELPSGPRHRRCIKAGASRWVRHIRCITSGASH